ncbi:uncharacterized protein im:7147486 [Synchiropus splendidus]|uniref:uncharacterized protein im:7147486 n=1 Tax=Synchiropus splendidus TaxID=270530 RepID=UPI00237EA476|nr:uncharacterized protein im:7147486 [Synchiropus splendidus]
MMLGLQESASSKLYHCVACTATFTALPALLVHQATHADSISNVLPQTNIAPSAPQFANTMSAGVLAVTPATPSDTTPSSFYICDCGEQFLDFNLMLEHKRTHVSQTQSVPPADDANALSGKTVGDGVPSASWSPPAHEPREADRSLEGGVAIATTSPDYFAVSQEDAEEHLDNIFDPTVQKESADDSSLQEESDLNPENVTHSDNNGPLMKVGSAADMKHFPVLYSALNLDDEDEVADVMAQPEAGTVKSDTKAAPNSDLSVAPMKKLLSQSSLTTKAPPIAKILESSREKIVSLTKSFSPVVVLETRQKLIDPCNEGTFGNIQCGRCRRLFSSMDKLTEHHFLHKKERVKCCRCCKQLIIGKLPFPNNHICPLLPKKPIQLPRPLENRKLPGQNLFSLHSNNTKKVYFCPVCKHTYARRYNLKKHKCQGPLPHQVFVQPLPFLGTKNIGVGTEVGRLTSVKVEGGAPESKPPTSDLSWDSSLAPLALKPSTKENHSVLASAVVKQEDDSWEAAANESSSEGQWTMPLDEDMELDGSSKSTNHLNHPATPDPASTALRLFNCDGPRRYSCTRCQKTYTRINTLKRHLRLCGFRPHGQMTLSLNSGQRFNLVNTTNRPMHSCFVCGRLFNRKDNMMTHRKRCQLKHRVEKVDETKAPQNILLQSAEGPTQEDNGNNWSIMSLPSVLPRRVTCECGVGFTSPKLLLQHLQKHAQESYTCPTCGETVNSWADYEVHLQIHMQSHLQQMTGRIKPSQPLLLRFQPQPTPTIPRLPPPAEAPQPRQNPAPTPIPLKKKLRILCSRCGNTFASRCSLRRHLTLKRCKDTRVTMSTANPPKALHCTHCNLDFPNTMSLIFHQRSGACKPTIKPVRCHVCLRWFATVEGLQKHMLTHKQSTQQSFRCDICQGTYSSLKSLKNHRRRIHRILVGMPLPKPQEPLASQ